MRYQEETYARQLYGELNDRFYGDQNTLSKVAAFFKKGHASGIKVSIKGAGVHWKCIVAKGDRECHIHCFHYDVVKSEIKGAEYYTYYKLDDGVMATGRTQEKQDTIDAAAHWCNNESLYFLYERFEFIDRECRALERIQADVLTFYPEI